MSRENMILKEQVKEWIICSLKSGAWAPLIVFSIHVLATLWLDVYSIFPSFDIPMHFIGGVSITYFFIKCVLCALRVKLLGKPTSAVIILMIFLLTCTTTIFWEFIEWTMDELLQFSSQVSLDDTLLDMLLGILGAVVMIGIKFRDILKKARLWLRVYNIPT